MLCYEKWIMEDKPVGEVLESAKYPGEVLTMTTRRFPWRKSTLQRDLQNSHGTFKMGTTQQIRHGNGQGWDSEHREWMHKWFFYANGSSNTEEDVQFCNPGGESVFRELQTGNYWELRCSIRQALTCYYLRENRCLRGEWWMSTWAIALEPLTPHIYYLDTNYFCSSISV